MTRGTDTGPTDVAEAGFSMVFPAGLRGHLAALEAESAPVEAAVAAGWAGFEALQLVTADLHGSAGVAPSVGPKRAPRTATVAMPDVADDSGPSPAPGGGLFAGSEMAIRPQSADQAEALSVAPTGRAAHAEAVVGAASSGSVDPAGGDADVVFAAPTIAMGERAGVTGAVAAWGASRPERGMAAEASGTVAPVARARLAGSEEGYRGGGGEPALIEADGQSAMGAAAPVLSSSRGLRADVRAALSARAASTLPGVGAWETGPEGFGERGAATAGAGRRARSAVDMAEPVGKPGFEGASAPQPPERESGGMGGSGAER